MLLALGGQLGDGKAALRKTAPVTSDAPNLAHLLATEPAPGAGDAQREFFFQAAMDQWVDGLAAHTFKSEYTPITKPEADAILATWRGAGSAKASDLDYAVVIPPALSGLVARVDAILAASFPGGAFVKLSTRSPKDSKTIFRRAEARFQARVAAGEVPPAPAGEASESAASHALNARLVAFSEDMVNAAIIRTGAEAVTLLLDSERVGEDLAYACEEGPSPLPISLVVRAWDARMRPQCEFRAFVWGGKINALGQYWHSLFFPELQDPALLAKVSADIVTLFESIRGGLPVPNAMLDIAWMGLGARQGTDSSSDSEAAGRSPLLSSGPRGPAVLVEVNPLMEGLGSFPGSTGLFDYYKDADILQGVAPYEMRVRTAPEPREELLGHMSNEWRRVVLGF